MPSVQVRQAMPDGTLPTPGGWNRFAIETSEPKRREARLHADEH